MSLIWPLLQAAMYPVEPIIFNPQKTITEFPVATYFEQNVPGRLYA